MKTIGLLSIALAAAIGLSGCSGPSTDAAPDAEPADATASASSTPSPSDAPSPSVAPSPSATPSASATAGASAGAGASATATAGAGESATASEPASPEVVPSATPAARPDIGPSIPDPSMQLLTTADGLYSFRMPADWSALTVEPTAAPDYGAGLSRTAYSIRNGDDVEIAVFSGGVPADGAALPSPGHVLLDSEELPALSQQVVGPDLPVNYVFDHFPDPTTGSTTYLARLHLGDVPADGTYGAPLGLLPLGSNGLVLFTATFDATRFADPAAARAWMASEEYVNLRAMFTSLTFNG